MSKSENIMMLDKKQGKTIENIEIIVHAAAVAVGQARGLEGGPGHWHGP